MEREDLLLYLGDIGSNLKNLNHKIVLGIKDQYRTFNKEYFEIYEESGIPLTFPEYKRRITIYSGAFSILTLLISTFLHETFLSLSFVRTLYVSGILSISIFLIGNIIGLNRSKEDTLGNDQTGIFMINHCDSNEVVDNFIGGNSSNGIYLMEGSGNVMINNNIGCNIEQPENDFGNGSCGISIYTSDNHIEENTIAYNSVYGVQIYGAEALRNNINRNRIFDNGWGGLGGGKHGGQGGYVA